MMKLKFFSVCLLFILALPLYSAEINFKSQNIKAGDIVDFTYSGKTKFKFTDKLKIFVYSFQENNSLPAASEFDLSYDRSNNYYIGSFAIPQNAVFCLLKVSNGEKNDDNNSDYWQTIVSDVNGKPVKNANLRAALAKMGNLPDNCRPAINYNEAFKYLKDELKNYPNNLEAKIGLVSLQFDLKNISKNDFENQLKQILNGNNIDLSSEGVVRAVSRAYKTLNQTSKADEIEKDYARNNVKSNLCAELFLANLAKAQTFGKFAEGSSIFLRSFPESPKYENMLLLLADNYLDQNEADAFVKAMRDFNRLIPDVYSKLAFYYLDKQNDQDKALMWMSQAVESAKNPAIIKDDYMTSTERALVNRLKLAEINESLGILYEKLNKDNDAVNQLLIAKDMYGNFPSASIYENIAKVYIKQKTDAKAVDILAEAVVNNQAAKTALSLLEKVYKTSGDSEPYSHFLDSLNKIATAKRIEDFKDKMLNKPFNYVTLENSDGLMFDLSIYRGKTIVIDFWSTWCDPCTESLQNLDKLSKKYKNNSDIVFIPINVWDKLEGRYNEEFKEFLDQLNVKLPYLIDAKGSFPKELGLSGLPVRLFIDKNGLLQFVESGNLEEDEAIRNADDKLNILLND